MKEFSFWVGLLLAIPLSILANILTAPTQKWWDARTRRRAIDRTKNLMQEYERVKPLATDRAAFHSYLLWVVLRTTFIGSLIGIVSGLVFLIPNILDVLEIPVVSGGMDHRFVDVVRNVLYGTGQVVAVLGSLMVVNICREALRTYYRVEDFEAYEAHVKAVAANL